MSERRSIDRSISRKGKVSRLWVSAWLLAAGFWGTAAQAQMCGDLFRSAGTPTELIAVDTSTNPFTISVLGSEQGVDHNALAQDPMTGSLYAIQFPGDPENLLQISSDGTGTSLGPVTGLPDQPFPQLWNMGAFASDGIMYVADLVDSQVPFDTMYGIDVSSTPPTATPLSLSQSIDPTALGWFDGLFYGVSRSTGDLFSVDLNSGSVATIGPTGVGDTSVEMVSASNGVFGLTANSDEFICFDTATGAATVIAGAPNPSGRNDAAHCLSEAFQFDVDLVVTKDDGGDTYTPGEDVVYEIVVTNNGPFGVCGATVSDPLPDGITTASWTCAGAAGGVCGAAAGSGALTDTASLPVGGSVTYTYTVSVPADYSGDLVNTATAETPQGFTDLAPADNTATDTNANGSPGEPGITVEKTASGPDPLTVGGTVEYSFLITNTGAVELTGITIDDPLPGLSAIDCPGDTLAPGAEMSCTATYEVTQDDVDAGAIENTVTVSGLPPGGGPPVTAETTETWPPTPPVPALPSPALALLVALLAATAYWMLHRRARA